MLIFSLINFLTDKRDQGTMHFTALNTYNVKLKGVLPSPPPSYSIPLHSTIIRTNKSSFILRLSQSIKIKEKYFLLSIMQNSFLHLLYGPISAKIGQCDLLEDLKLIQLSCMVVLLIIVLQLLALSTSFSFFL